MKRNKEAKFFCESCGAEVPRNAKTCPKCGKFFASVRCPKCGKTGTTDEFKKGCPHCGYAVHGQFGKSRNNSFFGTNKKNQKSNGSDSPLPIWIYIVCIAILIGLVILLYSCL